MEKEIYSMTEFENNEMFEMKNEMKHLQSKLQMYEQLMDDKNDNGLNEALMIQKMNNIKCHNIYLSSVIQKMHAQKQQLLQNIHCLKTEKNAFLKEKHLTLNKCLKHFWNIRKMVHKKQLEMNEINEQLQIFKHRMSINGNVNEVNDQMSDCEWLKINQLLDEIAGNIQVNGMLDKDTQKQSIRMSILEDCNAQLVNDNELFAVKYLFIIITYV